MQMIPLQRQKVKKVKEESEKVSLKLSIQKTKLIASSLITSWENIGNSSRLFLGAWKSLQVMAASMNLKHIYDLEEK